MIHALLALLLFAPPKKYTAVVSWTWTQDGGDPAQGFRVRRAYFLHAPAIVATVPVTQQDWTDTTVRNGEAYIYYVTAFNQKGDSQASPEKWVVIPK